MAGLPSTQVLPEVRLPILWKDGSAYPCPSKDDERVDRIMLGPILLPPLGAHQAFVPKVKTWEISGVFKKFMK